MLTVIFPWRQTVSNSCATCKNKFGFISHADTQQFLGHDLGLRGKSWAVASVIQKLFAQMPQSTIVLFDLHGEYAERHCGDCAEVISASDTGCCLIGS